jgi:hypothetical protein
MAKGKLPPGVPAEGPGGGADDKPMPKFGVGRPADPDGPIPRVVEALERTPDKARALRFKIRCNNYHPQPTRYVLAKDEASAKDCYLKANGLDKLLEKLKAAGGVVEPPDLIVTVLAD